MAGADQEKPATSQPQADAMTVHQLAERSGVPARRIRHYVAEGVLPRPIGRGRAAHYRQSHLVRLQQIQALRDHNLGLDEIRRRLGEPSSPSTTGSVRSDTWRRWEIAPGIELQVRDDLGPEDATLARLLVGVARQLLADRQDRSEPSDDQGSPASSLE